MTDYAKVVTTVKYSKNSDYSDPKVNETLQAALTPDVYVLREATLSTSALTPLASGGDPNTITTLVIYNSDSAIDITAVWTDGDANANTKRIPAGRTLVIPDIDASGAAVTLTADSGTPEALIFFCGT